MNRNMQKMRQLHEQQTPGVSVEDVFCASAIVALLLGLLVFAMI